MRITALTFALFSLPLASGSIPSSAEQVRVYAGTADLAFCDLTFPPPFSDSTLIPTSLIDDFWSAALTLGTVAHRYADEFLDKASEFSDSARERITALKSTVGTLVEISKSFSDELSQHGIDLNVFSEKVTDALGIISEEVQQENKFGASSAQSPLGALDDTDARDMMITRMLAKLESSLVEISSSMGIPEERSREHVRALEPHVRNLITIVGDLIKEHPMIFETIIITVVFLIIPESLILRPILNLFGFGILGPVEGSIAAWAQRFFWGAAVKADSWFAVLQSMGMVLKAPGWIRAALIAVWVAVVTATQRWFGS